MSLTRSTIRSIREVSVSGKRVLLRTDFNVPLKAGEVVDDLRIKSALPTINFLIGGGAKEIIILTHLGRPQGNEPQFSLAPVEAKLKSLINEPRIRMYENLRFDKGEETNDPVFAAKLASMGDMFVNDAFAVSHRAHASVVGVAKLLPSFAGLLLEEEISRLSEALTPPKNSIAIIGGAKFETKQPLIEKLLTLYSKLFLGGALGNDIIKARGMPFGSSLISSIGAPESIAGNDNLFVLSDAAVIDVKTDMGRSALVNDIRAEESIQDIGPTTANAWAEEIKKAPFVVWNGPLGVYEKGFVEGTNVVAQALVEGKARAVVGGGDTAAALQKISFDKNRIFLSTGGGAMLEFLANGTLPGIEVLR